MKKQIIKYGPWIAAVLIITGAAFFFFAKPDQFKTLDSEYFQPEEKNAEALLNEVKSFGFAGIPHNKDDSLAVALDLYGMAKYEETKESLENYLEAYPEDFKARFYLGMSYLYLNESKMAFQVLSPLSDLESFEMQDDARWYAALSASNLDKVRATGLFSIISKDPGSKYQEAAALVLSSIKNKHDTFSFKVSSIGEDILAGSLVVGTPYVWWQAAWFRGLVAFLFPAGGVGILFWRNKIKKLEVEMAQIEKDKKESDDLLLNILPAETAAELKKFGHSDTRRYEDVTVLFCDIMNFTGISEQLTPETLVSNLSECFEAYDHIMTRYHLEKIKTVGDCYICAGGLTNMPVEANPEREANNAITVINAAHDILDFLKGFNERQEAKGQPLFQVRIGIHTGPVIAGVVGVKKYHYDIWGDTVNIAARMESAGEEGRINISGATYERVKGQFCCQYRGKLEAKGSGTIDMYFVG